MRRLWALFFVVALPYRMLGQQPDETRPGADSVVVSSEFFEERLFDQIQTEPENLESIDNLQWRQEHPFDLNTVTAEELESVPGVTPAEALAVVRFRLRVKRFTSIAQLKVMEDIGESLFQKLAAYIKTKEAMQDDPRIGLDLRSRASRDLQPRRGFLDGSYAGSSLKSHNRATFTSRDVQVGGLFEKDAGEKASTGFLSWYIRMNDVFIFSQLIAGDYVVEAGQGLVLWRASAFGKGTEISIARKSGLGAVPYRSSDEFNFLRGIAGSSVIPLGRGEVTATVFLSRRSLDGSVDPEGRLTSLYESGLFRTESERQRRQVAREDMVGGRVRYASPEGWNLGSTFYHSTFNKAIVSDRPFDFAGTSADVVGIDGCFQIERLSLFAEAARSGERASAVLVGGLIALTPSATAVLVYRDYSPRFNNLHAQGFGETDNTKNERGLYLGLRFRPMPWLSLSGYLDQFKFPWQTFENPLPSRGHDILLESSADFTRALNISFRYSTKSVETTEPAIDPFLRETRLLMERDQQKTRATATYVVNRNIRVKGRLETTTIAFDATGRTERGYLFYQDIRYTRSPGFNIEGRLVFFDTDSYNSRLYEYENDLHGVFSNPALYGKGRRWYLLIRYDLFDALTVSAKYQQTEREEVSAISSGDAEILGNVDNRFTLQLDLNW
ncbi:MAG TPA: helix-hairpin-helix domain-containing protein [Bacteroidota bacterium]|nr:helix-hairpin-helix domain-containing protein [Bacteroidota bacterium]